jgi:hypothetical protein
MTNSDTIAVTLQKTCKACSSEKARCPLPRPTPRARWIAQHGSRGVNGCRVDCPAIARARTRPNSASIRAASPRLTVEMPSLTSLNRRSAC